MTAELDLIDSLPVAAFATDAEGRVVRHNAAAAALWGRSPAPGAARWSGAWRLLAADGEPLDPAASPVARTLAEGRARRAGAARRRAAGRQPGGLRRPPCPAHRRRRPGRRACSS